MKTPSSENTNVSDPGAEDALEFLGDLWSLEHALHTASKRMALRFGVTGTQRFVVRMLGRNPGMGAGELAERMHDHPSTLTGVLQRLVEAGLIERRVDAADRRRAVLNLSARGRELDALREGTIEAAVGAALARLDPAHVAIARAVLAEVVASLDEQQRTPG
ncbi:MAG TPA: MarR family transcriptional regulator [Myxococcota bacterium]|nr:MarR family transcriptional regulator [Myxococcota bacterium]